MARGHDHNHGTEFECDCGETFETEEELKDHDREEHGAGS